MLILTIGGARLRLFLVSGSGRDCEPAAPRTRRHPRPGPGRGVHHVSPPPPSSPRCSPCCCHVRAVLQRRRPLAIALALMLAADLTCCRRCWPIAGRPRSGRPARLAAPGAPAGGAASRAAPSPSGRHARLRAGRLPARWPRPCSATGPSDLGTRPPPALGFPRGHALLAAHFPRRHQRSDHGGNAVREPA